MRKFLTALIVIPLGVLFVVFAVANRHLVTVSFDPFNTANPSIGVTMPLFIAIIAVAILGVIAGSVATWVGQHHWRRAARRHEADARQARMELADLRVRSSSLPRNDLPRTQALLPPTSAYGLPGRDKHDATL
ncbi:lipopolysaccharide assembly protein LapA domain-containing protein [soil metagenome]